MDPVSILGIVGVCCTITARAVSIGADIKTVKKLFQEGYNTTQEIDLVAVQVQSLNVATTRLSSWLGDQKAPALSEDEITCLSDSLDACDTGIARIQEHVLNVKNAAGKVGFKGKVQHWWNEHDLKKYQDVLAHQVQAMSLLMSTFTLPDAARRKLLLADSDSQSILEVAKDDASSICWIHEKDAIDGMRELSSSSSAAASTPGPDDDLPKPEARSSPSQPSTRDSNAPLTSKVFPRKGMAKFTRNRGVQDSTRRPPADGVAKDASYSYERELQKSPVYRRQSSSPIVPDVTHIKYTSAPIMNTSAAIVRSDKDKKTQDAKRTDGPNDGQKIAAEESSPQRRPEEMSSTEQQLLDQRIALAVEDSLKDARKQHEREIQKLKLDHERRYRNFEIDMDEGYGKLRQQESAQDEQHKRQLVSRLTEYDNKYRDLRERLEASLSKARVDQVAEAKQHEESLMALKNEHEKEVRVMERDFDAAISKQKAIQQELIHELADLKKEHASKCSKMESAFRRDEKNLIDEVNHLEQLSMELEYERRSQMQAAKEAEAQVQKLEKDVADLKAQTAAQEEQAKEVAHKQRVRQEQLHAESARRIQDMETDMEWHLQKAAKAHEEKLVRVKAEHEAYNEDLKCQHVEDMEALESKLASIRAQLTEEEAKHDQTVNDFEVWKKQCNDEHKDTTAKLRQKHETDLLQLEKKIEELDEEHATEIQHLIGKMKVQDEAHAVAEKKHKLLADHLPMLERLIEVAKMQ